MEYYLDLRGLIRPVALLKVTQIFRGLKGGETLEILLNDVQARTDLLQVLNPSRYLLLELKDEQDFCRVRLTKS